MVNSWSKLKNRIVNERRGLSENNTRKKVYDDDFVVAWIDLSLKASQVLNVQQPENVEESMFEKNFNEDVNQVTKPTNEVIFSSINPNNNRKQYIFEHVSGTLCSGEVMAILGSSGCGKSSVLKCLTGNIKSRLNGKVCLYRTSYEVKRQNNFYESRLTDHKIRMAFIPQFDSFFECLTVYETMLFTSRLVNSYQINRLNKKEKHHFHNKEIKNILQSLDLFDTVRTKIKSLSGGQLKRLSIAVEIMNRPLDVLILDEPTSGLDSSSSFKCVQLINRLVKQKKIRAALMVLHQPSAIVFNLIDKLYIMSKNGSIIYNGPTKELIEFLEQANISVPMHMNPADRIIEIASGSDDNLLNKLTNRFCIPIEQYINNIKDLAQLRYAIGEFKSNQHQFTDRNNNDERVERKQADRLDEIRVQGEEKFIDELGDNSLAEENAGERVQSWQSGELTCWNLHNSNDQAIKKPNLGFWPSFFNLTRRYIYLLIKDRSLGGNRIVVSTLLGLFVGYMYGSEIGELDGCPITLDYVQRKLIENGGLKANQTDQMILTDSSLFQSKTLNIVKEFNRKKISVVIDSTSNMFFIVMVLILTNMIPTLTSLASEYRVVAKEINNLNYNYTPHFFSKMIVETLFSILLNLIFISITYGLSRYPLEWNRFVIYASVLVLFSLIIQSQALIVAALFVNNYFATIYIGLLTIFPLLLYTGYLIKIFNMPFVFEVFSSAFPSFYTYEVMLISIFGMARCSGQSQMVTRRKLYALKSILKSILLKTFDEDERNDGGDVTVKSSIMNDYENYKAEIGFSTSNQISLNADEKHHFKRQINTDISSAVKETTDKLRMVVGRHVRIGGRFDMTMISSSASSKNKMIQNDLHTTSNSDNMGDMSTKSMNAVSNIDLIRPNIKQHQLKQNKLRILRKPFKISERDVDSMAINYSNNSHLFTMAKFENDKFRSSKNSMYNSFSIKDTDKINKNLLNKSNNFESSSIDRSPATFSSNLDDDWSKQSTGHYEHFNLINNLKQLVNSKNLVRFLRLTHTISTDSSLNDGKLIANSSNSDLQRSAIDDALDIGNFSQLFQNTTLLLSPHSNTMNNSFEKEIKLIRLLSYLNDSSIDDYDDEKVIAELTTQKMSTEFQQSEFIDDSSTETTLNKSNDDETTTANKPNDDEQSIDPDLDDGSDQSKISTDQPLSTTTTRFIDGAQNDLNDDQRSVTYQLMSDEATSTKQVNIDDDGLQSTNIIDPQQQSTENSITRSTLHDTYPTKADDSVTRTEEDKTTEKVTTKSKMDSKPKNKINIYRLPIDPNITDDQIEEYKMTSDMLLHVVDNFFKRFGVPEDDEEESDEFEDRSRVLIIYDVKSDDIKFHFQFLIAFLICIRTISYFVYKWRIHKFD